MKATTFILLILSTVILQSCSDKGIDSDCKGPIIPQHVACTDIYQPVCGCDGKTYGNACYAEAEGVKRTVPGPCDN